MAHSKYVWKFIVAIFYLLLTSDVLDMMVERIG